MRFFWPPSVLDQALLIHVRSTHMAELTFPHQSPATPKQGEQFQAAFQNQTNPSPSPIISAGFLGRLMQAKTGTRTVLKAESC